VRGPDGLEIQAIFRTMPRSPTAAQDPNAPAGSNEVFNYRVRFPTLEGLLILV
jgi:hypothetical protein